MDLFERMKEILSSEISTFDLKVEIISFRAIGVFGCFKVIFFTDTEVEIAGRKSGLKIFGENLKIKRSDSGEIYITGDILGVEKTKFENKKGEKNKNKA